MQDYEDSLPATLSSGTSLAVQLAQAELNQNVTAARTFPRSLTRVRNNIMSLVTLDKVTAEECIYVLPRGGKPIKGPSIRFAEIVASTYGHCQVGARVVAIDRFEKIIIAEGVFHDLETGMRQVSQIQRRISDKNGKLFNDDMIAVTGNAAMSIARRNAILAAVPKALWRAAFEAVDTVILGEEKDRPKLLVERRERMIQTFAQIGVTGQQLFDLLEVGGVDDVQLDDIVSLTAIFRAIRNGESSVEAYFPKPKAGGDAAPKTASAKLSELAARTRRPAAPPADTDASDDGDVIEGAAQEEQPDAKAEAEAAVANAKASAKAAAKAKVEKAAADKAAVAAEAEEAEETGEEPAPAAVTPSGDLDAICVSIVNELGAGATMDEVVETYFDFLDQIENHRPDLFKLIMDAAQE